MTTPDTTPDTASTMPPAIVLSGTGGTWRIRLPDGAIVEAYMRGRLKRGDDERRRMLEQRRGSGRGGAGRQRDVRESRDNVEDGEAAPLKLAVGDEVTVVQDDSLSAWAITGILPRRSRLARRNPGGAHGERIIAANVDQVLVVFAAANPEPHPRMLDRFLVIAEANGLLARIVINKVELVGEKVARARFADYEKAGYPLHFTSVKEAIGLEPLRAEVAGRSSALSGPSGVGKSSLMNALFPGLELRTQEISESVNKGRHTTVGAWLHPIPAGGYLVDTPGLREVGMWGLQPEDIDQLFPEFRPLLASCRFGDCTHKMEPDCGVRAGVKAGRVSRERYESYVKLREELEAERPW